MLATILLPITLAVLPIVQIRQPTRECRLDVLTPDALEERVLVDFDTRLRAYVGLHRRMARSIGASAIDNDEAGIFGDELRVVLVAARPLAAQGDFFTPSVAEVFRSRVDRALLRGVAAMPVRLYQPLGEPALTVNHEFPFIGVSVEWPALFMELPRLPRELGYALWGRDLVLVDVATNLVLDVLPEALPEGVHPGTQYQ